MNSQWHKYLLVTFINPYVHFPDVSISYVAQLDVVGSGLQIFDNEALASASGVEALGLTTNQLMNIGEKSLL